jgi:hypothetical protein
MTPSVDTNMLDAAVLIWTLGVPPFQVMDAVGQLGHAFVSRRPSRRLMTQHSAGPVRL